MGRIMDRVRRAAERGGWESPATKAAKRLGGLLSKDLVIQVLKNPKAWNRRTRRSVGLYLSPYAWPRPARAHLDCRVGRRAARRQRRLQRENS